MRGGFQLELLVALTAAAAAGQTPLTLQQAEETAAKNQPRVSVALLTAAAANQVTIETRAAALPTVFGSVTGVGALNGSRIAAGGLNNPIIYDRVAGGFTVSQLITDFGRTSNLTASAKLRAQAQQQTAAATRAEVLLQTDRAYFAVLRSQSVLTVAHETVNARQLLADQITALANSKLKSGLDVSFANVNLTEAKLLLADAENDVKANFAELSAALGYPDARTFQLSDPGLPPAPAADAAPLVKEAMQSRPDLLSARLDVQGAERFAQAERDLSRPTIEALATAGAIPAYQAPLPPRYAAGGVNVNIPILNGHLFAARRTEAELRSQAAAQNARDLENRIAQDIRVAWLNAGNAWQRLGLTAELLAHANQALDLAQARYNLGLSSIVELSQAQLNKTSADIASITAKYEYELQQAVLNYQTGANR